MFCMANASALFQNGHYCLGDESHSGLLLKIMRTAGSRLAYFAVEVNGMEAARSASGHGCL